MALKTGSPTAPLWVTVLEVAAEWGTMPEQILEGDPLWFERWKSLRDAKIKANKLEQSKARARNKRGK